MELFLKLFAVLKAALPVPDWANADAVAAWLGGLNKPLADVIASLAAQLKADGFADVILPGGAVVTIIDEGDRLVMSGDHQELLCAAASGEMVEGKWLDLFKELLPIVLQILSIFMKKQPEPAPQPTPPPVPPVV